MKLGIRVQLVLALSALLTLSFVPLFSAVSRLTRATLRAAGEQSAVVLGRTVARSLARASEDPALLASSVRAELDTGDVLAIGVYDASGRPLLRDDVEGAPILPDRAPVGPRPVFTSALPGATLVILPEGERSYAVIVRREGEGERVAPLRRLVGLYTALFGVSLLVFSYIALTRLIVRPVDRLSSTARRVAAGARQLVFDASGPAEVADLSASLAEMTARLTADEERMRGQIAALEHQARALGEAQDRLVRSERLASVGRLSAGLAHEIGNPLASILGLEDLLLAGGLTREEELDFLRRIRSETERIHGVLRKLLDFARPASSRPPEVTDEPGSVNEAIAAVSSLVRHQPAFRDLALEVSNDEPLPRVTLPKDGLMQVLLNLLLNAADAAGRSGRVCLSAERLGDHVEISVEDDGPGIDPRVRGRLFEPFVTTKDVGKGTGLGLAVCRGLVESAQGSIALDESRGQGTRFVVRLPAVAPPQAIS